MFTDPEKLRALTWQYPKVPAENLTLREKILFARGFDRPEKRRAFMDAKPFDPFAFSEMEKAITLLRDVVSKDGKVMVFGDYDADGLTATAILVRFLERLGARVSWLIPDRLEEGYGLSETHVKTIINGDYDLCITVDCGSNNAAEVLQLKEAGIEVIVSDHHVAEIGDLVAGAHINPRLEPEVNDLLSGAGVALQIVQAYVSYFDLSGFDSFLKTLSVLAMVGTVADIMPLAGANRALVKEALADFSAHAPVGLLTLVGNLPLIDAATVSYKIAPSLNAASRLGETESALLLLLTDSLQEATLLSERLRSLNETRRKIEQEIAKQAIEQAEALAAQRKVIVVRGDTWHMGVIGIVAARLVERYKKPAIVFALNQGEWQGSARSFSDIDMHALLAKTSPLLTRFGGHRGAAGLALTDACYDKFCEAIELAAGELQKQPPYVQADLALTADDMSQASLTDLSALAPFGEGNPEPKVVLEDAEILSLRLVGKDKHTRLDLLFKGQMVTALRFQVNDLATLYAPGDRIDLCGVPMWNVYNGQGSAQLIASHIRPSERAEATHLPRFTRAIFEEVYRTLRRISVGGEASFTPSLFAKRLSRAYNRRYAGFDIEYALHVLAEASILTWTKKEAIVTLRLVDKPKRVTLSETGAYRKAVEKGWLIDGD